MSSEGCAGCKYLYFYPAPYEVECCTRPEATSVGHNAVTKKEQPVYVKASTFYRMDCKGTMKEVAESGN